MEISARRTTYSVGPASLRPELLRRLERQGVELLLVELSQVPLGALERTIGVIRGATALPVALATEGPLVRTGLVESSVRLDAGDIVRLTAEKVLGNRAVLTLRPAALFEAVHRGTRLAIDGGPLLRVGRYDGTSATAVVVEGGEVGSNRAVLVDPAPALPPLSDKDRRAVELALRLGVRAFVLSMASGAADVDVLRRLAPDAEVGARIESRDGVWNRDEIIQASDAVAVDPAALLREMPVEQVALYEEAIVRQAARWHTPVLRPVLPAVPQHEQEHPVGLGV